MKIAIVSFILLAVLVLFAVLQNFTPPSDLGVKNGRLASLPSSPNAVSSQAEDIHKKVAPFPFKENLNTTKEVLKRAIKSFGNIQIIEEREDYIHAVSTTPILRFHDDLEFYFDQPARLIHFRSASRVGYSDMGLNRTRYEKLLEAYKKPMQAD